MVKFFILDVQQSGSDKPEVMLWGRNENGDPVLVIDRNYRPYFFVEYRDGMDRGQAEELARKIGELTIEGSRPERTELQERKLFGKEKKLIKITLTRPNDVIRFRDKVKEWTGVKAKYEHSISFYRRYLVDTGITPMTWVDVDGREDAGGKYAVIEAEKITPTGSDQYPKMNMMALDIELVEEGEEERIIMVSVKDNRGFRKVLSYKKADVDFLEVVQDEKGLIGRLSEIIGERDPDILVTYNGDRFDFRHLSERARKYGTELRFGRTEKGVSFKRRGRIQAAFVEGRVHLDLFNFVENILTDALSSDSLSLDSVSREILGKGKKRLEWDEMQNAWEKSRGLERIVKYCMTDSELALSLARAFLPQISELCRIVGQGLFDVSRMTYSQLVEWLLMRESRKTDELIPNRPKYEEIQIRRKAAPYTGGYVYPPKEGIHQSIALFDFMSVSREEPVVLRDCGGKVHIEKIGEFIDRHMSRDKKAISSAEIDDSIRGRGWDVLCFDEKYGVSFKPVTQISRHPNPGRMLEIMTKTGREIRVTGNHSLFTVNRELEPVPVRAASLKAGRHVLIPRYVEMPEVFKNRINVLEFLNIDSDFFVLEPADGKKIVRVGKRLKVIDILSSRDRTSKEIGKLLSMYHSNCCHLMKKLAGEGLIGKDGANYHLTKRGERYYRIESELSRFRKYEGNRRMYRYRAADVKDLMLTMDAEMLKGWKIGVRNCKEVMDVILELKPLSSLLGWYASEGCMIKTKKKDVWRKGEQYQWKVCITPVKKSECDEIKDLMKDLRIRYSERKDGVVLSSKLYYGIFDSLGCGKEAHEKKVPDMVYLFDGEHKKEFMLSYLKGDGHCYGNYYGCVTVSRNLANSLALLASSLGLHFNINRQKSSESKIIKGRTINCSESYFMTIKGFGRMKRRSYNYPFTIPAEFCPEGFRTKNRKVIFREELAAWAKQNGSYKIARFAESNLSLDRVVSIKEIEDCSDFVYDIEVEPTQNFLSGLGWIIAHNSLYPSITITHNVSPETLYCQCVNGDKSGGVHQVPGKEYYFCKTHPGFVSATLKTLVDKRRKIKDQMKGMDPESEEYRMMDNRQHALKILANASYGYYGYAGSRWYSRVCAQSITAWGRYYIQKVIRKAEKMGYEVVYGDTDSLFVRVRSEKEGEKLLEAVNRTLPGAMELEFQGLYRAGIFVPAKTGLAAKKRYALIDEEGEITIRGFEIVRRDWSPIARETQEKVLLAVLRDNSPEQALSIAKKTVQRIQKGAVDMDRMIIHTQLTRPLKEYEQIGPHVVAAQKALKRGRPIAQGSMISYVVTKGSGSISERAEPAEDAENYDPDYYVNNQVVPAAMRVLAAFGYTEGDLLSEGDVQYSLEKFVGKSLKKRVRNGIRKIGGKSGK